MAYHCVLFLDELQEFCREVLCQPLEESKLTISRTPVPLPYTA